MKCNRGHKNAECRETKPTKSHKPSKNKSGFHGAKIADQDDEQDQDLGSGQRGRIGRRRVSTDGF